MVVHVYGKAGCGKCENAKSNLVNRLGLNPGYTDITNILTGDVPENWRDGEYVDILAAYSHLEDLPLVRVGDDEITTYPKAMKELKRQLKESKEAALVA